MEIEIEMENEQEKEKSNANHFFDVIEKLNFSIHANSKETGPDGHTYTTIYQFDITRENDYLQKCIFMSIDDQTIRIDDYSKLSEITDRWKHTIICPSTNEFDIDIILYNLDDFCSKIIFQKKYNTYMLLYMFMFYYMITYNKLHLYRILKETSMLLLTTKILVLDKMIEFSTNVEKNEPITGNTQANNDLTDNKIRQMLRNHRNDLSFVGRIYK
jgi:hypothetical protein